jgi:putative selenate reductase molybdopterin-binding subunit
MSDGRTIGRGEPRRDGIKLVTGRGTFTDDASPRGALQAWILTSPHAHAKIVHIQADVARATPGVAAVLTHEDGLLNGEVRYAGAPVALVAALDVDLARRAAESIEIRYETLPTVLDAAAPEAELVAERRAEIGNVEAALAGAEHVIEQTYRIPRVSQCAIEPQMALAWLDEDERLVVRTSSHVPFHVRQALARRLGLPARRIRVLAPRDGGGFGGRLGIEIEDLCAAVALKTGRPVRLARTREQELVGIRAGHEQTITIRGGLRDGKLVALDMTVLENAGAADSPDWAVAALATAGGVLSLYRCPNVRYHGRAMATNLPPAGAIRADGASQALFALESHIDEMARAAEADAVAFRQAHHVREGDPLPIVEAMTTDTGSHRDRRVRSCGIAEALERGGRAIGWSTSQRKPTLGERGQRRGVGVALALQAPGAPGAEMSAATVDMLEDGSFHLFVGTSDIGAGTETVLCQIAAEVLGAPLEAVVAHAADTDVVPFASGPMRASALYVSGLAVRDAALQVRSRLLERAAHMLGVDKDSVTLADAAAHVPDGRRLGYDEIGRSALLGKGPTPISGAASSSTEESPPATFAAVFAEVDVDTETGIIAVRKLVLAVDCGQVLNPTIATARLEGGALQGAGYALSETVRFDAAGHPITRTLRDYPLLSARDTPAITTVLVPTEEPSGPFGAKSIGEIGIHGVAPAIANAVANATGARVTDLPLLPERVLTAIAAAR